MTIAVVLIEDRHTDVEVKLFLDSADAIQYAQTYVADMRRAYDYVPEEEEECPSAWLYYASYSTWGDCARIVVCEVE